MTIQEFEKSSINELLRGYRLPCPTSDRTVFLEDFFRHVQNLPVEEFNCCIAHFIKHSEWDHFPVAGKILSIHRELFPKVTITTIDRAEEEANQQQREHRFTAMEWFHQLSPEKRAEIEAEIAPKIEHDMEEWRHLSGSTLKEELAGFLRKVWRHRHIMEAWERN